MTQRMRSRLASPLALIAVLLSLLVGGYYLADSLSGRDTVLASQIRLLGFCPGATVAAAGAQDCPTPLIGGDLIPSADNTFSIGTAELRWKDIELGPGTLYFEDRATGQQVGLSIVDGALLLDGADSLRIGNIRLTRTGIESIAAESDITIGNFGDSGYALFPTGIKFADGSTMTSAAGLGIAGSVGARGVPGPTGVTGPIGPAGYPGVTGPIGPAGSNGLNGNSGATGARGLTGATGATGAAGVNGAPGSTGPAGPTGLPGLDGSDGARGERGLTGADGVAGVPGSPGADGADGADGEPGLPGADGAPGVAGSAILEIQLADGDLAIDLAQQLIVLGAGNWTLADGIEGQVLYFVTSTGANSHDIYLTVAHLRYQDGSISTLRTNGIWDPFAHLTGGTHLSLITMAIFSQGAWSVSAGEFR